MAAPLLAMHETVQIAVALITFGARAIEAMNANDEAAARRFLKAARDRVKLADQAWTDAEKPGDDQG